MHILDIIFFIIIAFSVIYVAFFAFVSFLFRNRKDELNKKATGYASFLVIFPSYHEDLVIVNSVNKFLCQDYPSDKYNVIVVSDHQTEKTNSQLENLPVTLLKPIFDKSTKAKALQYAMHESIRSGMIYDYIVILDADNVVETNFLSCLNVTCQQGYKAIQCHRKAKNGETDVAIFDGISEEINNTIFRLAHNKVGLSSSLIGSGLCLEYKWFLDNVDKLSTAGEDREIESLLIMDNIYIKYEEGIFVFDEKVDDLDSFQRQRQRWIVAQAHSLLSMLPYIPHAITKGNINYIDKTLQQALIPRSMLIVILIIISIVELLLCPLWSLKWWLLLVILAMSLILSIPAEKRKWKLLSKWFTALLMTLQMFRSASKIPQDKGEFIHTSHNKKA